LHDAVQAVPAAALVWKACPEDSTRQLVPHAKLLTALSAAELLALANCQPAGRESWPVWQLLGTVDGV
jgi:hypothetical protein